MNPIIYDEGDGIRVEIPIQDGIFINISMDDDAAQEMIDIIQNKLNARYR
jgi:hypothetical protein